MQVHEHFPQLTLCGSNVYSRLGPICPPQMLTAELLLLRYPIKAASDRTVGRVVCALVACVSILQVISCFIPFTESLKLCQASSPSCLSLY